MPQIWAGVDAAKGHHHCVAIDGNGQRLLSRKVKNDENELLTLIADVAALAEGEPVLWATDLNQGGAALMIQLLVDHKQELLYIPGRTIHHASKTYRGDGKPDAKDTAIITDQARMRRDLQLLRAGDQLSTELRLLTARRLDLVALKPRLLRASSVFLHTPNVACYSGRRWSPTCAAAARIGVRPHTLLRSQPEGCALVIRLQAR